MCPSRDDRRGKGDRPLRVGVLGRFTHGPRADGFVVIARKRVQQRSEWPADRADLVPLRIEGLVRLLGFELRDLDLHEAGARQESPHPPGIA